VVFDPVALTWRVKLGVTGVTEEEIDVNFAVLKGVRVVIQGVVEVGLNEFPFVGRVGW
jgi:hypothetical protein